MTEYDHKIYARHSKVGRDSRVSIPLIKSCIRATLALEGVDKPCEISVLITDDVSIHGINWEFRGVDSPTDVLSFPMTDFDPPGWTTPGADDIDPETGLLPLGDIVLSAEWVDKQAQEYGHTRERETAYLTAHSVLHLLGYDHVDDGEGKRLMREREEAVMQHLNLAGL